MPKAWWWVASKRTRLVKSWHWFCNSVNYFEPRVQCICNIHVYSVYIYRICDMYAPISFWFSRSHANLCDLTWKNMISWQVFPHFVRCLVVGVVDFHLGRRKSVLDFIVRLQGQERFILQQWLFNFWVFSYRLWRDQPATGHPGTEKIRRIHKLGTSWLLEFNLKLSPWIGSVSKLEAPQDHWFPSKYQSFLYDFGVSHLKEIVFFGGLIYFLCSSHFVILSSPRPHCPKWPKTWHPVRLRAFDIGGRWTIFKWVRTCQRCGSSWDCSHLLAACVGMLNLPVKSHFDVEKPWFPRGTWSKTRGGFPHPRQRWHPGVASQMNS